ncbi:DODA-type extradiol aromatic ring-opening family dioxygenase [Sphaerochaeta pleomorpha]|uniref:DODA-type extradiol aromatic ring-opening family dioxygenase n=1 Tax=Sphaerochaeta pleomorpha TaxID=1131707 RepID=UPI0002D589AA|nr:class III extradiol ring-cleavage dioxygenase [Sphaerochaeta pleomorpha]
MKLDTRKGQVVYFSHGGGPLPLLGDKSHQAMVAFLKDLPAHLHRPEAIVVVSAHWEEAEATVISSKKAPLLYDYYGFPKEAYNITYPALGNPVLAEKLVVLLEQAGIHAQLDQKRGYDHGVFVPLKLMYPQADIPVIQLSLLHSLDSKQHLVLGKALSPLLEENILWIGSGFSFHNMHAFSWEGGQKNDSQNDAFQNYLIDACSEKHTQFEREELLLNWE